MAQPGRLRRPGRGLKSKRIRQQTIQKNASHTEFLTLPSHLAQLRQLQDENAKLKRMYADLALMHHALKDVVDRKL